MLRFSSTGEIRFTGDANDRAGVAGSPAHKFVSGSPLPAALAGALIGRIDNGLPFGIGDQSSITVPASGLLYLGTNDDNVNDNSGQFQVVISSDADAHGFHDACEARLFRKRPRHPPRIILPNVGGHDGPSSPGSAFEIRQQCPPSGGP